MTAGADNALGEFLRARRGLVGPEEAGLHVVGPRRVPGLRREELASLAGISIDYLVRLERGRDRHPSSAVVDALARALGLDAAGTAHLHGLARPGTARVTASARVRPAVARLVETTDTQALFVLDRLTNVLAANRLAEALHPGFLAGTNLVSFVVLDPRARERYVDWDDVASDAVATLRGAAGAGGEDAALAALVGDLSVRSEDFRRLWARHDVRDGITGRKRFDHPSAGRLELDYESFAVTASPGQVLVAYGARPGSADERRLFALLGG